MSATCTKAGLTAGKKCSVCGEITVAQTVIPITSHSWGALVHEVAATTTTTGTKAHYECSNCDAVSLNGSVVCNKNDLVISILLVSEGLVFTSNGYGDCYVSGIGTCTDTDIVIPSTSPIGDKVIGIGSNAFEGCISFTSIEIPDGVTSIGYKAFSGCHALKSISIPDGVTSITDSAFYNCTSLTSIVIPDNVTNIGNWAFYNCTSLTSVVIGDSVTSIRVRAFSNCRSLTSVVIGDSVTWIDDYAFDCCYKLVEVINKSSLDIIAGSYDHGQVAYHANEVHNGESKIINYDDYLFYTYDGVNYLLGYAGNDIDLILPDNYNGESYEIYKYAFRDRDDITSVVIGDSVTSIGYAAFSGCYKLVEVINKSSLDITAASSNYGNIAYYSIEVHNGESKIVNKDDYLFYTYNGVNYLLGYIGDDTELILPDNYNSESYDIYSYAFYNCTSLISIEIPGSVTSIGKLAFYNCTSLTSIAIPDSVTSIGDYVFRKCSGLTSIDISNSVKSISYGAFYECSSLTSIDIPDSVTSIGDSAFSYCTSLTSIEIPDGATSIGGYFECTSLTSIIIPDSVTSIEAYAFYNCRSLTSIKYRGTQSQWKAVSQGQYWDYSTGKYTITYNYKGE